MRIARRGRRGRRPVAPFALHNADELRANRAQREVREAAKRAFLDEYRRLQKLQRTNDIARDQAGEGWGEWGCVQRRGKVI